MPTTIEKLYQSVMGGMQDNNIKFKDLQNLLIALGFQRKENNGDHFLYNYLGIKELINIQPDKKNHAMAKAYQVKQVRNFLKRYNIKMEV
ncbi:MAG: type II toxin-antitoxin system HicA family toxin [Lachnospiraceae bacterium]|nr:type II toxin-antitoxin system HicA family toxin [Lachnospiraceae bacterium]